MADGFDVPADWFMSKMKWSVAVTFRLFQIICILYLGSVEYCRIHLVSQLCKAVTLLRAMKASVSA